MDIKQFFKDAYTQANHVPLTKSLSKVIDFAVDTYIINKLSSSELEAFSNVLDICANNNYTECTIGFDLENGDYGYISYGLQTIYLNPGLETILKPAIVTFSIWSMLDANGNRIEFMYDYNYNKSNEYIFSVSNKYYKEVLNYKGTNIIDLYNKIEQELKG